MAVEYSEIMAGAAMFYSNKELDFFSKDENSLVMMLKDFKQTISSPLNVYSVTKVVDSYNDTSGNPPIVVVSIGSGVTDSFLPRSILRPRPIRFRRDITPPSTS